MNTPKTKPPQRFSNPRLPAQGPGNPDGRYTSGVWNDQFCKLLGELATYWPHVEEDMIAILRDLLGGDLHMPARQIFRSIYSNQARKKIMQSLLERSKMNESKGPFYDEVIDEFYKLNGKRNDYLHGLWYTHETQRMFLSEQSIDDFHFFDSREVKIDEIEQVIKRMSALKTKILNREGARPSRGIRPPPPAEENI